jgi:hypothetical protein
MKEGLDNYQPFVKTLNFALGGEDREILSSRTPSEPMNENNGWNLSRG